MMKITAIVLSAGKGTRLGSDIPKQYIKVCGKPLLCRCLESFEKSCVDDIVIVTAPGDEEYVRREIVISYGFGKVSKVVAGGAERYDSVLSGLRACECDYCMIHDGARPFITSGAIDRMAEAVQIYDAAVAAVPSKDTVKITDDEGYVVSTTVRSRTWAVQTPQCFRYDLILGAYETIVGGHDALSADPGKECGEHLQITDDAMVFETVFADRKIRLIDIRSENMKITTPEDLRFAEWYFSDVRDSD